MRADNPNEALHAQAHEFARQIQIPEAIAFQIVRGDFTLKQWMEQHTQAEQKRQEREKLEDVKRQKRRREEGMAQQYFLKQKKKAVPLGFALADQSQVEGLIVSILPYHFWVEWLGEAGQTERLKLEKLQVLYCYKAESQQDLAQLRGTDPELRNSAKQPPRERSERYTLPAARLEAALREGLPVQATLIDGTRFLGTIDWYSRHFLKLKVGDDTSVVIFNHALHTVR